MKEFEADPSYRLPALEKFAEGIAEHFASPGAEDIAVDLMRTENGLEQLLQHVRDVVDRPTGSNVGDLIGTVEFDSDSGDLVVHPPPIETLIQPEGHKSPVGDGWRCAGFATVTDTSDDYPVTEGVFGWYRTERTIADDKVDRDLRERDPKPYRPDLSDELDRLFNS